MPTFISKSNPCFSSPPTIFKDGIDLKLSQARWIYGTISFLLGRSIPLLVLGFAACASFEICSTCLFFLLRLKKSCRRCDDLLLTVVGCRVAQPSNPKRTILNFGWKRDSKWTETNREKHTKITWRHRIVSCSCTQTYTITRARWRSKILFLSSTCVVLQSTVSTT